MSYKILLKQIVSALCKQPTSKKGAPQIMN